MGRYLLITLSIALFPVASWSMIPENDEIKIMVVTNGRKIDKTDPILKAAKKGNPVGPSVESINFVLKQSVREVVENSLQQHGVKTREEYFQLPGNTLLQEVQKPHEIQPPYEKTSVMCSYLSEDKESHKKYMLLQFELYTDMKDNTDNKGS